MSIHLFGFWPQLIVLRGYSQNILGVLFLKALSGLCGAGCRNQTSHVQNICSSLLNNYLVLSCHIFSTARSNIHKCSSCCSLVFSILLPVLIWYIISTDHRNPRDVLLKVFLDFWGETVIWDRICFNTCSHCIDLRWKSNCQHGCVSLQKDEQILSPKNIQVTNRYM